MIRLWWVRHAPVTARGLAGRRDVPADLSDRAALERLARFLPEAPIFTSPLLRTRATAAAIAGTRPVLPPVAGLREFDFGAWEGLTPAEIAARDPALSRRFWTDPSTAAPPGGESWSEVAARVDAALGAKVLPVLHRRGAQEAVIVSHFGVIATRIAWAGGLAPRAALAHPIPHLSVTRIDLGSDGGAGRLVFVARCV